MCKTLNVCRLLEVEYADVKQPLYPAYSQLADHLTKSDNLVYFYFTKKYIVWDKQKHVVRVTVPGGGGGGETKFF